MRLARLTALAVLILALLATPLAAEAQPTGNVHIIGFLGPPPSAGGLVQAFQQGLRDLGYVEGQAIRIVYRYTDVALQGHPELFPRLAAELVRLKPDVLVVSVAEAALAAKNATSTIPIVMVSVPDPVAAGLITSLARPGGNVTGLSRETRDLVGKDLQLLKEALPETVRVGVLGNLTEPLNAAMVSDAKEAAKSLGVELKILEAGAPAQLEGALASRGEGFEAYEAIGPVPERCRECGAMVSVELPRFAEPPVHLDLTVVHEPIQPDRARHVVDLQSFSATGRVLLASRLFVRTRTEPT